MGFDLAMPRVTRDSHGLAMKAIGHDAELAEALGLVDYPGNDIDRHGDPIPSERRVQIVTDEQATAMLHNGSLRTRGFNAGKRTGRPV